MSQTVEDKMQIDVHHENTPLEQALYRRIDFSEYVIGPDQRLVLSLESGERWCLPEVEFRVLVACGGARTIYGHILKINSAFGLSDDHEGRLREMMKIFIEKGLLRLASSLDNCRIDREAHVAKISSVAVVTANRVLSCSRLLDTLIANFSQYGRTAEILILDDSSEDAIRDEYICMLREKVRDTGASIRYLGRAERIEMIRALVDHDIPAETSSFLLLGEAYSVRCTAGANRNAGLLELSGKMLMMIDDDMECLFTRSPTCSNSLRLQGHSIPRETTFFASRSDLMEKLEWGRADFLSEHEVLLGRSFQQITSSYSKSGELDASTACVHLLRQLDGEDGRLRITMIGVAGASGGTVQPFSILAEDGRPIADIEEGGGHLHGQPHEVLSVTSERLITHERWCATGNVGIDNRELMPPFSPIGRGQDGVFAAYFGSCFDSPFFAHLPLAILHNGLHHQDPNSAFTGHPHLRIAELLIDLSSLADGASGRTPGERLSALGVQLVSLATAEESVFQSFIDELIVKSQTNLLEIFASRIDGEDLGVADREYATALWNGFKNYVMTKESSIPIELRSESLELGRARVRDLTRDWGKALIEWPRMNAALQSMTRNGRLFSIPISSF